nr:histidine phosphatase family protein [Filibacter tadaridae]
MEKTIYIVRHCSAEGQSPHADLTAEGILQTEKLAAFFEGIEVDRIITSPFVRARMTAEPIAVSKGIHMEGDSRLTERILSSQSLEDWQVKLKMSFSDLQLKYKDGESSSEAMARICAVVDGLGDGSRTVLVTHGNLMALLLKHFDDRFGFKEWQELTNPDVYRVRVKDDGALVDKNWSAEV